MARLVTKLCQRHNTGDREVVGLIGKFEQVRDFVTNASQKVNTIITIGGGEFQRKLSARTYNPLENDNLLVSFDIILTPLVHLGDIGGFSEGQQVEIAYLGCYQKAIFRKKLRPSTEYFTRDGKEISVKEHLQ